MVTSENEKASSEEASFYVTDRLFIEKRLYKICTHISLVKLNTASACQPEAMLQRSAETSSTELYQQPLIRLNTSIALSV